MRQKRLIYLDTAKGIGIIAVMLGHSCGIPVILPIVTGFYMALFFIIAGMTTKEEDFLNLSKLFNKKKKLIVDYFLFSMVLLLFSVVESLINKSLTITKLSQMLIGIIYSRYSFHVENGIPVEKLMCIENSPLWFLTALFLSFLVAGGVYKCQNAMKWREKKYKKQIIIFIILLIFAAILNTSPIILPWSIDCIPTFVVFIIAGKYIADKKRAELKITVPNLVILSCVAILYLVLRVLNGHINISIREYGELGVLSIPLYTFLGLFGTYLCLVFCYWLEKTKFSKKLALVGRNSLFIMSFHMLGFHLLGFIIPDKIVTNVVTYYAVGLLENIITLIVCMVLSITISKQRSR